MRCFRRVGEGSFTALGHGWQNWIQLVMPLQQLDANSGLSMNEANEDELEVAS